MHIPRTDLLPHPMADGRIHGAQASTDGLDPFVHIAVNPSTFYLLENDAHVEAEMMSAETVALADGSGHVAEEVA